METSKRVLGAEHPDTLNSIANLALTYWSKGQWDEAEELEVQVMETRKRGSWRGGIQTRAENSIKTNLASTYRRQRSMEQKPRKS